ncbi:hypothetical protein DVH24_023156 [Malus domestica]|uniref:RNase H type-1 domain-containing protein n=1 Tax=Malus domestica TaxID=3750 RepID=A0A498KTI2_MALDO|nr:hypothetical protein DVH24_023156 [Malus domestica]
MIVHEGFWQLVGRLLRLPTEALALLHGSKFGISLGLRCLILESNFQESISCLNDKLDNGSWKAYLILAKSWTPRSASKAVDLLASQKSKEMCDVSWVDRPPSSLVFVLHNDGLPCPP